MANRVLKLAMDNLSENFEKNKRSFLPSKIPEIKEGSQLFVLTSQRSNVSYKIARKWTGPYVCWKLLEHNNHLLKPLTRRKIIKVHKNLCKLVEELKEHLCLNDSNPFALLLPINDSYRAHSDNRIEPNPDSFADYEPEGPGPGPQPPPPPPLAAQDNHSPQPSPPPPEVGDDPRDENNEESAHSYHSPPSSPPPAPPPPTPISSGRLTRSRDEAAGISLPTPSYQKHTIEFSVGKSGREKKKMAEATIDDAPEPEQLREPDATVDNPVPSSSSSSSLPATAAPAKKRSPNLQ